MTEQPIYGLIAPANMPHLADLNDDTSPYPAQITITCDGCPGWCTADYLVPAESTKAERFEIARGHMRNRLGWSCDENGDYCPECAMTANPTTDQILANLAEINRRAQDCDPMPDGAHDDVTTFVQRLTDTLPGVGPALAGQVLLRTADVYGMWVTADGKRPITHEALIAVRMLGAVGQRMYLGDHAEHAGD